MEEGAWAGPWRRGRRTGEEGFPEQRHRGSEGARGASGSGIGRPGGRPPGPRSHSGVCWQKRDFLFLMTYLYEK